jgi:hypothetical protein
MEQFINGTIFHRDRNALDQQAAGVPALVDVQATEGSLSISEFEGPQFQIEAFGLNDIPYGIEIHNDNFEGTTITQLDGDQQFIRFEGGQRERVGIEPIWGKEARINVRTNEDLSPLFGLRDRDAEVRVFRTDSGKRVWTGYIVTDFFQDEPLTDLPGVELRAVDGLTTLENDSFDELSGVSDDDIGDDGSFISYTDLFTGILSTLYENPLDVEFAVEWYPDAGGDLGPDDNPLEFTGPRPDIYFDSDEGAWRNQKFVLEDALKSQGLEIRQAVISKKLTWLVAQPTALSGGLVKTWRYAPDGTEDASSPSSRILSLDLNGADTSRPIREFERRTKSVAVKHDHAPIGNLVEEGGFEKDGQNWEILATEENPAGFDIIGEVVSHSVSDSTPPPVQQNLKLLGLIGIGEEENFPQDDLQFVVRQVVGQISGIQPDSQGRLAQSFVTFDGGGGLFIRFSVGNNYLKSFNTVIRQDALPGEGVLPIALDDTELQRPIPKGSTLPIVGDSSDLLIRQKGVISLSEAAEPGDDKLIGNLSSGVSKGNEVLYPGFVSEETTFPIRDYARNPRKFPTIELLFAFQDENGLPISGEITYEIGGRGLVGERTTPLGEPPEYFGIPVFIDDISFALERDGNKIEETTRTATLNDGGKAVAGQTRKIETLLSSGPTAENAHRVKGLAPGDSGFDPTDYGIGVGGGDLSLAGLHARERLRYLRQHLQRLQLTVFARNKFPTITGEEIVQFNGKTWRIAEFSSDPYFGEIQLTLIQHEDFGVD